MDVVRATAIYVLAILFRQAPCDQIRIVITSSNCAEPNYNRKESAYKRSLGAPGPERPDAAKGDQEITGRLKFKNLDIRVVRFPGEQCGRH